MSGTTPQQVSLTCLAEFCASHFYQVPGWSHEQNEREFGKAANSAGHGHNYRVEVTLAGSVNPKTGMVLNIQDLKKVVHEVLEEMDHRNLNEEIPYFKDRVPSPENLCCYLFERISVKIPVGKLERVRIYETENLYAEFRGEYVEA